MRPLRTKLQSIGRFRSLQLDLTDLPENALLIAYDGAPGAGKSTLFRSLTWGAVFRKFKNSGSLKDLASGPDACLETDIEFGGKRYTAKHLVDGKQGASILTKEGERNDKRAKKKEFKASVEETFPPELLLSNTVWRDQKSLGFLELEQSDRRELILLATGATQWQQWFTQANAKANEHKELSAAHAAKATALQGQFKQDEFFNRENRLCQLQGEAFLANEAHAQAQRAYQEKANGIAIWESAAASYNAWKREQWERQARIQKLESRMAEIVGQQAFDEELLLKETEIREAKEKSNAQFDAQNAHLVKLSEIRAQIQAEERVEHELQNRIDDINGICERIEEVQSRVSSCQQAKLMVEELESLIATKEGALQFAETALENKKSRVIGNKDSRIERLRYNIHQMVTIIPMERGELQRFAVKTLDEDDELASELKRLPDEISDLVASIGLSRSALELQKQELRKAETAVARLPFAEEELTRLTEEKLQRATLEAKRSESIEKLNELDHKYNVEHEALEWSRDEILKLAPLASKIENLLAAKVRYGALQSELETLRMRISEEEARQSESGPSDPGGPPIELGEKEELERARNTQADAASAIAAFKETKRIMEETFERMAEFAGLALQHSQEEADWRKLANLIGRDGIQSALVDSAGPELSETVNYFLHTCFGNRWSQTISTQRESSDGKKTIEQCKVWVIDQGSEEDNAPPREGEGITFSGGEQEILSLAFQLALTYLARNSGIIEPDIYLDEPASSLNESMRAKWVHMLRVAAGLIGCKHIHFISHNEDVKRLADARVKVERGTATIVQGDNNGQ